MGQEAFSKNGVVVEEDGHGGFLLSYKGASLNGVFKSVKDALVFLTHGLQQADPLAHLRLSRFYLKTFFFSVIPVMMHRWIRLHPWLAD